MSEHRTAGHAALVGRAGELETLRATLAEGAAVGAALLVIGEPGIGKTSLLAAARAQGRGDGSLVLWTVGLETEAAMPFAGLQQLLSPVLDQADHLPRAQRQALLTALGLEEGPRPSLFLIGEAALALLDRSGERRAVVLVADDVQWLDAQTHEILTFLAHRCTTARLTVIGAARPGHPGPFVDAGFSRLVVSGLDDDSANQLLDRASSALGPRDRARIQQEAHGNPLALLELPSSWGAGSTTDHPPLSARLERAFAGRISGLPDETRDALLVAAVSSADDVAEVLAATTSMRGSEVGPRAALLPAVEANVVAVEADRLLFRHPLVRSGVLQGETVVRRQAAHRALAEVLGNQPFRRTWHLAQSIVGPDDAVADELEATVAESLRRGAVMAAVASLERAASLSSRSAVRGHRLLVAAEHAFGMGRSDVVDRLVREAAQTDLGELDWARMQWLREIFDDGVPGDAVRVAELADFARRSAAADDLDLALNLLLGAALRCWWADTGPEARRAVATAIDDLPTAATDPRHLAALAVAEPVLRAADVDERLAALGVEEVSDADALRLFGMAAHAIGDAVLATDLLDRSEAVLREQARLGLLPHVLGMQVHIRHELGDWAGALSAMYDVRRLAVETGQPIWTLNNEILYAQSEALHGRGEQALEILDRTSIEADRRGLNDSLCLLLMARGTAHLVAGRPAAAYANLRRTFDPADPSHHPRECFSNLGFLAEAAVATGETHDARRILTSMEHQATVTPSPVLAVHLLYARAVLASDVASAEVLFHQARTADLRRWPWPSARVAAAYGTWLLDQQRAADARPHLEAALAGFEAIGAPTWSEDVRLLLERAASS